MSSLARTRSLRKPTQGSSTDLPATSTAPAAASSSTAAAAAAATVSTASAHRPVSPSRLPAPRSLAAPRPTTRSVSGASVASTAGVSDATKKKKPNPISTLFGRKAPTRQPAGTAPTRQKDAAAAPGGGSVGSGPPSAPLSRTSALAGLTRTSSTREPGLTRTRHPANASTSNLVPSTTGAQTRSTTTRPTTSGGVPASKLNSAASSATSSPTKGHARARSVATLNGSTVLRPPSQTSASDRGGRPAPARPRPTSLYGAPPTAAAPTARPRPPSATDRPSSKPSVSSLSSTTTATTTSTSTSTTTRPTRTASTSVPSKPPAKPQPQLSRPQQASPTSPPRQPPKPTTLRPAFNTLQQHYSPAKSLAPKPLTATYLAPPSPSKLPTNVALTAETARLQTELLQLHLLHRDLPQTTAEWHASARTRLAARHASLGASSADLARLEAAAAERLNVAALRRWARPAPAARGSPAAALEHKIQRLDALLTSLWSLDAPGGKHSRLVRAFERWASALPDLEAARARAEDSADPSALLDANAEVRFGGGLDARWKEEAAALVRKLEGWDAQLRELEYVDVAEEEEEEGGDSSDSKTQVSSLKRTLDGCGSLVRDMLDELAVMEEIEAAAVEREAEWIRRMNREGDDGPAKDTPRAGAVWRVI